MSSHDEDRLAGSLRERAGDISASPGDLGQVRDRARGIRRRRRVVRGLTAVVVVVAVALPVTTRLTAGTRADRSGPPAASSQSPDPRDGVFPLTAENAPRSGAPQIDYQQGRTLHRADGSTSRLPAAYSSLTPYRGGILATETTEDGYYIVHLGQDMQELRRSRFDSDLAVSLDGARVAWASFGDRGSTRTLHVDSSGDPSEDMTAPAVGSGDGVHLVGFLDPDKLVYQTYGAKSEVRVLDNGDRRLEGLIDARGTSQRNGLVSGLASYTRADGWCYVVRDVTGRRGDLWRTCDFSLGRFSPNGRYVLAGPAFLNGMGDSEVAVLDARTGAVVAHWQRAGKDSAGVAAQSVWESTTTVLTPYREDGAWHLLRLDLDGRVSEATEPVPAPDADTPAPWTFTVRP